MPITYLKSLKLSLDENELILKKKIKKLRSIIHFLSKRAKVTCSKEQLKEILRGKKSKDEERAKEDSIIVDNSKELMSILSIKNFKIRPAFRQTLLFNDN